MAIDIRPTGPVRLKPTRSAIFGALRAVGSRTNGSGSIATLAAALDKANSEFLNNNKSPSRKAGELDTRGSHFYLAMYWAQALAEQTEDGDLQARFSPVAKALTENETKINEELTTEVEQRRSIQHQLEIARQAGGLYDKFVGFIEAVEEVGVALGAALASKPK